MRVLPFTLLLAACGTVDTTSESSSNSGGYSFGSTGSDDGADTTTDDSGDTDSGGTTDSGSGDDTDSDTDTGTDSGDSGADCKVTAELGFIPQTTWDPSVTSPATANPTFNLWHVGNDTTGDYDGYGIPSGSSTSSNAYITVEFTYCPGDTLVVGGDWNDGRPGDEADGDRWLSEANGVVNILPDSSADDAKRIIIDFGDGNWQGYQAGGAEPSMGEAGWVDNGDGGGDLFIATFDDTDTHDDRL